MPLALVFVMDPIENEPLDGSTTIVLMREAQDRGHTVFHVDPDDLEIDRGRVRARAVPIHLDLGSDTPIQRGEARILDFDAEVDVAFQRKDPPVDRDFIVATQILDVCQRTIVLNRPEAVIAFNEKLLAIEFPDLMPETLITSDPDEIARFRAEMGDIIIKPLYGNGGAGVFHLRVDDRNLSSLLEMFEQLFREPLIAQRYLPAVRQGDKRIILVDGEPVGAINRVPAETDARSNMHVGGRAEPVALTNREREICDRIGPSLRERGFLLVGIDVIGDVMTEINVTSPTGIREVKNFGGNDIAALLWDAIEAKR